jgi:glycosyl transferase family 87
MRRWHGAFTAERPWRWVVIGLYAATSVAVVVQRGILGPQHSVFKIFRQSFWHLAAGRNLYAPYPAEQGALPADLFKYSPTAALLFAPLAAPPYGIALFAWSLLGAFLLYRAFTLILESRPALIASLLIYPDLLSSMQACSSNAHVAALIILAYAALERRRQLAGAIAIVGGAALKIFPLAALTFALFHPRRWRFALVVLGVLTAAFLLPLLVTPPRLLIQQYRWWYAVEQSDALDLAFGLSAMSLFRHLVGGDWPNWPVQVVGTLALLLPLTVNRERWSDPEFRIGFLASLLGYAVLFNHQAERPSFVIASAGVAIWCVSPPRGTASRLGRGLVGALALVGLKTVPLLLVWLVMQAELYGWRFRRTRWGTEAMVGPLRGATSGGTS